MRTMRSDSTGQARQGDTSRGRLSAHETAHRRNYEHYHEEDQPRYVISVAAQILGVHPQTLRLYEREGLVEPKRTGGKIRLYSERDIEKVRSVMRLTNDLGVNLAGAEAILNMRERMLQMHREMEQVRSEMNALLDELRRELDV
jgi:MerR family transcriptional regulator/heat shock protein HspR